MQFSGNNLLKVFPAFKHCKIITSHLVSAGLYELCQLNAAHDDHRACQPGDPARAVPEWWLHCSWQALGYSHWQQDVVRETHRPGTASATLPSAGRPQHLLWLQVRITLKMTTVAHMHHAHKECHHLFLSSTGSVISWISPQVGLSVSPWIRLLLGGRTVASRTVLSQKPTSPWYTNTVKHKHTTELLPYIYMYVVWLKRSARKYQMFCFPGTWLGGRRDTNYGFCHRQEHIRGKNTHDVYWGNRRYVDQAWLVLCLSVVMI